jgi:hypothetical protein
MSAAVTAKGLRQRIPVPEEIMAGKSGAGQRRRGRRLKKVQSCPPMDIRKLRSQKANSPMNLAQVLNIYTFKNFKMFFMPFKRDIFCRF